MLLLSIYGERMVRMSEIDHRTARYQVISEADGDRYRFFCEVSGLAVCITGPHSRSQGPEQVWGEEGRQYFNRCSCCGRWVSDVMYNADTGECVECSPWEDKPVFCLQCGQRIPADDLFCRRCGTKLRYGKVRKDE